MQPFQTTSHVGSWFPLSTLSRSEHNVSIRWLLSSAFKNYFHFKRDQQDRWDLCNSIIMSFVLPNDRVLSIVPQASFCTIRANTTTERKCGTSVPLLRTSPTSKNGASILNILLTIMRMQLVDENKKIEKRQWEKGRPTDHPSVYSLSQVSMSRLRRWRLNLICQISAFVVGSPARSKFSIGGPRNRIQRDPGGDSTICTKPRDIYSTAAIMVRL